MIVLDTSVIVDAFTGPRASFPELSRLSASSEHLAIPTLVLYEWLRGPRLLDELDDLRDFMSPGLTLSFGPQEAKLAAEIYLSISRARSREFDIGIAACTILHGAELWTRNPSDFADIPGLTLYRLP